MSCYVYNLRRLTVKIEVNGININYAVHGQGPELILIHGFGGNLTY
jgi:pimeloyl-ACP methyl ester carboxylesterase